MLGGASLIGIGGNISNKYSRIEGESFSFDDGLGLAYGIALVLFGLAVISSPANKPKEK